ncbi:cation:proton antiporter [Rhodoblastus acidophilus]|uniref:Cation:proton antiporter n=1 Tax=Candidatus Rhodoblastus alkanivorans TaxID=2954117 RepID=A0ABS9Z8Q4_9HYPH|nr:cation:proton antiporter [Candidatus Rhodoblastus alkanivorans]MCI4680343.1 cation:proton antiporter [Candidatus Rhodoblastus alkanivorans]MCI4684004.1 cation:proton antiporter [Candidatus Rhodoblastus alkanivorans]MDI4641323.1 cation:proton antiporter [Rhodoblastus acidophilus]
MVSQFDMEPYKAPLLFLGVAGVVVPLFRRLRVSPVLGFLIAGMLIGPHVLGRLDALLPFQVPVLANTEAVAAIASFGVVFLMFNIGLELSLERLVLLRRFVFGLGALQVTVCGVALYLIARALGLAQPAAIVTGAALALSSTAIVVPVLAESRRLNTLTGRAIFSVLLFQDLLVAPLLFMVSMFGGQSGQASPLLTFAPALAAVAAIVGIGRLVLRPLFQLVAAAESTELFMAACLLVVISTAVAAAYSGLSMALGAFIAGLLLAETEFRRAIEIAIDPFKGLLLGLFFVSIGASLDPREVVAHPGATLGVAVLLTLVKAPLVAALARAFGLNWRKAREIGLLLGPGGEFAFVILTSAVATGILPPELGAELLIGVTLSMAMIPLFAALAARADTKMGPVATGPEPTELAPASRVIIVGFGRVGQVVAELLRIHKIDYLGVDDDARTASEARKRGEPVYWGDATNKDFLDRCGLANARALVATMHTPSAVDDVVKLARAARADLTIVARARDAAHARALYKLGATDAVPETTEASLQLSEAALVDIGVPTGLVIASIHEQRDIYRKTLIADENPAAAPRAFKGRRRKR